MSSPAIKPASTLVAARAALAASLASLLAALAAFLCAFFDRPNLPASLAAFWSAAFLTFASVSSVAARAFWASA